MSGGAGGRRLLLSAPALLLADALVGPAAAWAALGLWTAADCLLRHRRPPLWPRQRRPSPARHALFWAAGCLSLACLQNAVPFPDGLPFRAGTVFFSLALAGRARRLPGRAGLRLAWAACAAALLYLLYVSTGVPAAG